MSRPERSERALDLFAAAVDLDEPSCEEFLERACEGDPALYAEVRSLLFHAANLPEILRTGGLAGEPSLELPEQIDGYRLLERVGSGGMGVVYRAQQLRPVRREVAVKFVGAGYELAEIRLRFESERQALALMDHPNIARVFDAGISALGRPYFVMEFVQGEPLTSYCDRNKLTLRARIDLFLQVCDAVDHAHRKAILHRDIKPANVLVADHGGRPIAKVIDFGVAKTLSGPLTERTLHTSAGQFIGTPEYMSPEQLASSDRIDERSDVYALGVLLHELLVGVRPFERSKDAAPDEFFRSIRHDLPARPSARLLALDGRGSQMADARSTDAKSLARRLKGDLDWIIIHALKKEPDRRYGSASELAADLSRYLRLEPVLARAPGRVYRLNRFVRRHWLSVASAAVILMLLIGSIIVTSRQASKLRREAAATGQALAYGIAAAEIGADPVTGLQTFRSVLERVRHNSLLKGSAPGADELRVLQLFDGASREFCISEDGCLAIQRGVVAVALGLAPDHPEALDIMEGIGDVHLGNLASIEAERVLREVVELRRRQNGPTHPRTLRAEMGLGRALAQQQRFGEAEPILVHVVEGLRRVAGETHASTVEAEGFLGSLYLHRGDTDRAWSLLVDLLPRARPLDTPVDCVSGPVLYNLGCVSALRGETRAALDYLEEAIACGFVYGGLTEDGTRSFGLPGIAGDPFLASLRGDPGFQTLVDPHSCLGRLMAAWNGVITGRRDEARSNLELALARPCPATPGVQRVLRQLATDQELAATARQLMPDAASGF